MKKTILLFLSFVLCFAINSKAEEITVESGGSISDAISSASSGDVIVLENGGEYAPGEVTITDGKHITIKAADGYTTKPVFTGSIRFSNDSITAAGVAFTAIGIEFVSNGENYFMRTKANDSISAIKFYDCTIHDFGRCALRASEGSEKIDTLIYSNTHLYNFTSSGYKVHWVKGEIDYFKMINSTVDGFTESVLTMSGTAATKIYIDHCTFNGKSGTDSNNIFDISSDSVTTSIFKITNSLITNMDTSMIFSIHYGIADTLLNCAFYDNYTCDTTNTWNYISSFTMIDPQYADADNYDLTLPEGSSLLTGGTDGSVIGDTRWSLSNNNDLSDLQVDGTTVEGFNADTLTYNVELSSGTTTVPTVTATAADDSASVFITEATACPDTITVTVTAEDGLTKTYTVNFTVATGIEDIAGESGIIAYVNRSTNELIIKNVEDISAVEVYSITGKKIGSINNPLSTTVSLDNFQMTNNSMYLIRLVGKSANSVKTIKITR